MSERSRPRWKRVKGVLLLGPALLLMALFAYTAYQRFSLDALMREPDGLVWESAGGALKVRTSEKRQVNVTEQTIRVVRDDGGAVHESRFEIDWNAGLSGGGFVKAMQADGDADLEVVAWASNADTSIEARRPFFLDHDRGQVSVRGFQAASPEAHALAVRWVQCHVVRDLEITVAIMLTFVYYVLCGLAFGAAALFRRLRKPAAS